MLKRSGLLIVAASLALLASGCMAIIGGWPHEGDAGSAYTREERKTTFHHDVQTVFNAAMATIEKDMKVQVLDSDHDLTSGRIGAMRADSKRIRVRLSLIGTNVTEVRVGTGTVADRVWSELFFEKLEARLQP
jgi:hypothetical protein